MYATGGATDKILDIAGARTAHLMEVLGNTLNEMDAAEETPEWVQAIFETAQKRWPQSAQSEEVAK
jgi:hypothetical protein